MLEHLNFLIGMQPILPVERSVLILILHIQVSLNKAVAVQRSLSNHNEALYQYYWCLFVHLLNLMNGIYNDFLGEI